jgi:KUP system potassium uptake protein
MVALVAIIVWRLPIYVVIPIFIIIALWDGMFLSAALTKIPQGAWVTLMIAVVLTSIFVLWRYGKEEQWKAEAADKIPLSHVVSFTSDTQDKSGLRLQLAQALGGGPISTNGGFGIFFDKAGSQAIAPPILIQYLQKFKATTEFMVLFHLRPLTVPTVAPEDLYTVSHCFAGGPGGKEKVRIPNCFRLTVRYGYTDEVITPDLGRLVADAIRTFLLAEDQASEETRSSLDALDRAYGDQVIYIVGKDQLRIRKGTNIFRWSVLSLFLWIRGITASKVQRLNVQADRLVEIGFIKEI